MKTGASRNPVESVAFFVSLGLLLLLAPFAAARSRAQAEERIKVLAHLPLPRMHVNQMFLQPRGDKYYLYLHRPTRQAFALVDVTNPEKPVLLERATLEHGGGGRVEIPRSEATLAVAVAPEAPATSAGAKPAEAAPEVKLGTETVQFFDISDPKKPKKLKVFTGVTSMAPDEPRHLLYLVNSEGLWVVSHREVHPLPFCTSTDVLMNSPNCQ
jgi:hypothetical protein